MDKRVAKLKNKKQYAQLTADWFNMRKNCITASSASSLLIRDSKTCDNYIQLYNLQDTLSLKIKIL